MRWRVDSTWVRGDVDRNVVFAGSPTRMFRVTDAGARVLDQIEGGDSSRSALTDRLLDAGAIHPLVGESEQFGVDHVTVITPQLGGVAAADGRITVDDGSVPPVGGATVRLDENRGPAAARNAGRVHADTELLAFVDADVEFSDQLQDPAWWALLLAHFDDPKVGLVAPRVVGDHGALDLGDEPARIRANTRVGYVPAAMIVVRLSAFDDVGGFDETLRYGEDVDLVWRLDEAGWRCRYEPARTVTHRSRSSWRGRLCQHAGYGSSSAPLSMRHPKHLAPLRCDARSAAALVASVVHPVLGLGTAALNTARFVRQRPELEPTSAARIAAGGQLALARQALVAVRRAWWPILLVASIRSRRARRLLAVAVIASPRTVPTDVSFGWGLWRSMSRLNEWCPIFLRLTATTRSTNPT